MSLDPAELVAMNQAQVCPVCDFDMFTVSVHTASLQMIPLWSLNRLKSQTGHTWAWFFTTSSAGSRDIRVFQYKVS